MLLICFMVLESNAILSLSKAACLHKDIYIGIVLSGIFQIRKLFYPFHESTILQSCMQSMGLKIHGLSQQQSFNEQRRQICRLFIE